MLEKINWTALNDYYNIKNHYNDKVVWFFSVRSYVSIDNVVVVTSMLLCVCCRCGSSDSIPNRRPKSRHKSCQLISSCIVLNIKATDSFVYECFLYRAGRDGHKNRNSRSFSKYIGRLLSHCNEHTHTHSKCCSFHPPRANLIKFCNKYVNAHYSRFLHLYLYFC